ncbi:hypothetical protein [Flavobacterium sp. TSSA_36]|uniref:hypothetical protein n=1 Tax=Flavobacterium sp. TSSA_36 TaxID=3447669 RepID=UPI003F3879B7
MKLKIYLGAMVAIFLISCEEKKEIQLPKANASMVTAVGEHSLVYIFFKQNKNDTIAVLNRTNTISSTNWIFAVDKRLSLRLVMPEIIKMQAKKEGSMHKSEISENYFSYADTVHKSLAFLPFTKSKFELARPKQNAVVFMDKDNSIAIDGLDVKRENFDLLLKNFLEKNPQRIIFGFSRYCSFGQFIQNLLFLQNSEVFKDSNYKTSDTIYVY